MSLARLAKKSIKAYKEGGIALFFKKVLIFFVNKARKAILYIPHLPPFSFNYKEKSFSFGYRDKYLYYDSEPKVMPEPSDTVIEAGVYAGKDTAMFAKLANNVIGFEPSPRNYPKAKNNLKRYNNIVLLNEGLWNEKDELEIQYSGGDHDDGFLDSDSENTTPAENIPVNTLEEYTDRLNVDEVNFLKIEAEGAEPEIIEGMGEIRPEKIAVNADEERGGESPSKEIIDLLQSRGYNLVGASRGHILYFVLDEVPYYAFRDW
jgi:FkbM family methyltransferase